MKNIKLTPEDLKMFDNEVECQDGFFDYLFDECAEGLNFIYFKYNKKDGFEIDYKEDFLIEYNEDEHEWDHKIKTIKPSTLKRNNKEDYKEFLKFKTYVDLKLKGLR